MTVLATVHDPDGRLVELTDERWTHIVRPTGHSELGGLQAEVLRAVATPDAVLPGRERDEVWFYARHAGPGQWLKVVVVYESNRAWIVTAFPRREFP